MSGAWRVIVHCDGHGCDAEVVVVLEGVGDREARVRVAREAAAARGWAEGAGAMADVCPACQ